MKFVKGIYGQKSRKKNKKIKEKWDEFYTKDGTTYASCRQFVKITNNRTKYEQEIHENMPLKAFPIICEEIRKQVIEVKTLVEKFHPLRLLHRGYFEYLNAACNKTSPQQMPQNISTICRMVDYIQSIIAADKDIVYSDKEILWTEADDNNWSLLYQKVDNLFKLINFEYHLSHRSFLKHNQPNYQLNQDKYFAIAQMYWTTVKGKRYYAFEIQNLKELLLPHSSIFEELFNITACDFIAGIERLAESLIYGWGKAIEEYKNLKEDVKYPQSYLNDLFARLQDFDLFNATKITNFPQKLLDYLSFNIGEDEEFAMGDDAFSPLGVWSVNKRPFLKVNGKHFCFDQLVLFDNLYRIIQKIIFKLKPEYKQVWNKIQQEQSENIACSLFKKLLPKSVIYRNVYTKFLPVNQNKKDWRRMTP